MEYRIYEYKRFEEPTVYFLQGRKKHNILNKIFVFNNEWHTINNNGGIHTMFDNPCFIYSTTDYNKIVEFKKWVESQSMVIF